MKKELSLNPSFTTARGVKYSVERFRQLSEEICEIGYPIHVFVSPTAGASGAAE
jgi:hypothetical protein